MVQKIRTGVTIGLIIASFTFIGGKVWSAIFDKKETGSTSPQAQVLIEESQLIKSPVIINSPSTSVSITESEIDKQIQFISVETKLLGTKTVGEEPPAEVHLLSGFGNAYLVSTSTSNTTTLLIQTPVRFNSNGNLIEVVNNFTLQPGSKLQYQPLENIKKINSIVTPIVTIVHAKAINTFKKMSISMKVNGKEIYHDEWEYPNVPFQQGLIFSIPLKW